MTVPLAVPGVYLSPCVYLSPALIRSYTVPKKDQPEFSMAGVPIACASCADFEECDLSLVASLLPFCSIQYFSYCNNI